VVPAAATPAVPAAAAVPAVAAAAALAAAVRNEHQWHKMESLLLVSAHYYRLLLITAQ
jgi:hypothetical protein